MVGDCQASLSQPFITRRPKQQFELAAVPRFEPVIRPVSSTAADLGCTKGLRHMARTGRLRWRIHRARYRGI